MRLRLAVEFTPGHSALGACCATERINVDALHERQFEHQPIVADGPAGNVMTAATHGQFEPVSAREVYRVNDVGIAQAAGNQCGPAIDHTVVYPPHLVVPGLLGTPQHTQTPSGHIHE